MRHKHFGKNVKIIGSVLALSLLAGVLLCSFVWQDCRICTYLGEKWTDISLTMFNGLLALFTFQLFVATKNLWKASQDQSNDMKESIAQSARSANAMERVAESIQSSAEAAKESVATTKEIAVRQKKVGEIQLRAYLSVLLNSGVYQERDKELKFEVKPLLVNNGQTPAHKVSYWAKAEILPFPLPNNIVLTTSDNKPQSVAVLGPHQNFVLNAIVDNYCEDGDVAKIKSGRDKRVFIWGKVTYEDIFGNEHYTNFCHSLYWAGEKNKEIILGHYTYKHNDSN